MTRTPLKYGPVSFLAMLPFCLASFITITASCRAAQSDNPPPAAKDADVRVLGREGRILLSRGNLPLCVAQVRAVAAGLKNPGADLLAQADAAAELKKASGKVPPLAAGAEQLREFSFPLPTPGKEDALRVILRARRSGYGTRLLFNSFLDAPSQSDLAPGESLPAAEALELAIQIYPDAQGHAPALTYADGIRQPAPADAAARAEAEARNRAGRTLSARSLVFEGAGNFRVDIARSAPAAWTLRRSGNGWLLRQTLLPDPRQPAALGGFVLYLGGWADEGPPEVSTIALSQPQTPARDFIEGAARVYASGADVFALSELAVVAEIACPPQPGGDVSIKRLPCFFWEAPSSRPAEGEFRFRFAPPREGLYGVRLVVVSGASQARSEALPFRAGPPASAGFVRARPGRRLFSFDNGAFFVPVGVRLALPPGRAESGVVRQIFIDLARRGVNMAHLVLTRGNFPLERELAGRYDADTAATLDEILRAAQVRGIHLVLGLESGGDLGKNSRGHPYFRERGGPLSASPEFFRDPLARKLYQSRLTYIAARYGAYRSIMSWELVDGLERVWPAISDDPDDPALPPARADVSRRGRRDIQAWAFEAAQFLHGMDQHEHPICVSTGAGFERPWTELENIATLDWVLRQVRFPSEAPAGSGLDNRDDAALLARWLAAAREPGRAHKPLLLETTPPAKWPETLAFKDPAASATSARARGALRQNWIHAGWAAGAAGPVLFDWSGPADAPAASQALPCAARAARVLEHTARAEGADELRYLADSIDITGTPAQSARLRYWGRAGRHGLCLWLQNPTQTWLDAAPQKRFAGVELKLPGLREGSYVVRWLDAANGSILKQEWHAAPPRQVNHPLAPLNLNVPAFTGALVLLVEPARQETGDE